MFSHSINNVVKAALLYFSSVYDEASVLHKLSMASYNSSSMYLLRVSSTANHVIDSEADFAACSVTMEATTFSSYFKEITFDVSRFMKNKI